MTVVIRVELTLLSRFSIVPAKLYPRVQLCIFNIRVD